jgi:hypothetical protein
MPRDVADHIYTCYISLIAESEMRRARGTSRSLLARDVF